MFYKGRHNSQNIDLVDCIGFEPIAALLDLVMTPVRQPKVEPVEFEPTSPAKCRTLSFYAFKLWSHYLPSL